MSFFYKHVSSQRRRRSSSIDEHFGVPGAIELLHPHCMTYVTSCVISSRTPARNVYSSGASVRSKRTVSSAFTLEHGRQWNPTAVGMVGPLRTPQGQVKPSQASPGLWWFGIELPSLASGQPGKEILRTEGLGDPRLS